MQRRITLIATMIALAISIAAGTRVSAQHTHKHGADSSWKKGMVRLNEAAYVGNIRLESGMYHVRHIVEGDKHWLVFNEVTLGAGYKEGSMWEGKEVARFECRVEPVVKSVPNTKVVFSKRSGRTPLIEEVQIAGEMFRHIVMTTPASES